jgi:hypothetical protein
MHTPEKRHHAICVFLLNVVIDVEKCVADQFHPQFFHLVDYLELQLVAITEILEIFLAVQESFRVDINFVVKRPLAIHRCVKVLSIHDFS